MELALAFYKGEGTVFDRIVRRVTQSPYSHVELVEMDFRASFVLSKHKAMTARAISASPRDGGVREKIIRFERDHWDFLPLGLLSEDAEKVWNRAASASGPYDFTGILVNFATPFRWQSEGRWFCSELIGHALRFPNPHLLAPGDVYRWVEGFNTWAEALVSQPVTQEA